MLMQKSWSSQLNPILANPLMQGAILSDIQLVANVPLTINHYLGRQMLGYVDIGKNADATVWNTLPLNSQTLTLEADANVTISLWVF